MNQFIDSLKKKAKDLQAELAVVDERLRKDGARRNDLVGALSGIETLLRVEGAAEESTEQHNVQRTLTINGQILSAQAPPLNEVLKEALADGTPRQLNELIAVAKKRGVVFGDKDPVKVVNFTLMGISKGKRIQRVRDDLWQSVGR